MPFQVAAHGFELTDAIRESCQEEASDKLQPLALQNLSTRWTLSLDGDDHVAHLNWSDGTFHGDATAKSPDMYKSIHLASKKAAEQMKKAHDKRFDHHRKGALKASQVA